jgi:hypothetical protein
MCILRFPAMEARAIQERLMLLGRAQVDIENADFLTPESETVSKDRLRGIIEEIRRETRSLTPHAEPEVLSPAGQEV